MSWANPEVKVHFDNGGKSRCGMGSQLTADRGDVTCRACGGILSGTWGTQVSRPAAWLYADRKPHGTRAAYRRHLRREGKPVRCERCLAAERRGEDEARAA